MALRGPSANSQTKVILACLSLFLVQPAWSFDTGHHADLTRSTLSRAGFSTTSSKVAVVTNWLVDYYSVTPTSSMTDELAKLHFDNLLTLTAVRHYWDRLAANTKSAVEASARAGKPLEVLALMGMSLHAVQDFYTHSNWVETHPAPDGVDYSTVTWFDGEKPEELHTGQYPEDKNSDHEPHGDYSHGLNHDSYVRPRWDKAYVHAYAGSVQWVEQIRRWVVAVDPAIWDKVKDIQLGSTDKEKLDDDLEASYRISEWIWTPSADGHWKGNRTGHFARFTGFAAGWMAASDSRFVKLFKNDKLYRELTGDAGRGDDLGVNRAATTSVTVTRLRMDERALFIRIPRAKSKELADIAFKPRFYPVVEADGQEFVEAAQEPDDDRTMPWTVIAFVPKSTTRATVRIKLMSETGSKRSTDSQYDIDPANGTRMIKTSIDFDDHQLHLDVGGVHDRSSNALTVTGKQGPAASLTFFITTKSMAVSS